MHKVKNRAWIVLILGLVLVLGMCWYVALYMQDGSMWITLPSNRHLYNGGTITTGTVLDRDGTVLAGEKDGSRVWAADAAVRRAMLHVVGDPAGNIGTGVLSKFGSSLIGYSTVSGLFSRRSGSMQITADAAICKAAYEAMGGCKGAAILYNYKNGRILAEVSAPNYDPASVPSDLLTNEAYEGVYINRALGATYTPGSTMKIVTLAAALEHIPDLESRTFTCTGSCVIGGTVINCQSVHGTMNIQTAFAKSCNCTFAQLALELGGETLASYMQSLGLTESLSIDGIPTAAGRFDVSEDGSAALAWSGVGQSTNLVCAANMMVMAGAIGNGGVAVMPTILGKNTESVTYLRADTASKLLSTMRNAVVTVYGDSRFGGIDIAAKSGTAELQDGDSHAWFVGVSCDPNYPCAFAVVLEHAGAGSRSAADVAAAMLKAVKAG